MRKDYKIFSIMREVRRVDSLVKKKRVDSNNGYIAVRV